MAKSLQLQEVLEAEFKVLHPERPLDSPTSTDPQNPLKALWIAVHGLEEKRAAPLPASGWTRSKASLPTCSVSAQTASVRQELDCKMPSEDRWAREKRRTRHGSVT